MPPWRQFKLHKNFHDGIFITSFLSWLHGLFCGWPTWRQNGQHEGIFITFVIFHEGIFISFFEFCLHVGRWSAFMKADSSCPLGAPVGRQTKSIILFIPFQTISNSVVNPYVYGSYASEMRGKCLKWCGGGRRRAAPRSPNGLLPVDSRSRFLPSIRLGKMNFCNTISI